MLSVVDLATPETLARLAQPANLGLGRDILDAGAVEITLNEPMRVVAKVGGAPAKGQRRTAELRATADRLEWSCACSRRRDLFCKHCVAVALALR